MSEGTRHQYGLPVSAFLGGISFTIMAFLIEMHTDNKFHYPMIDNIPNFMELSELVIAGLGASGTFFIVSSIGMIPVASGRIGEVSPLARCAYTCMLVGFYILCGVIALFLLPFSTIGAVAVAIISVVVIVMYSVLYGKFEE
jgi:uncharacterized membrane protein